MTTLYCFFVLFCFFVNATLRVDHSDAFRTLDNRDETMSVLILLCVSKEKKLNVNGPSDASLDDA